MALRLNDLLQFNDIVVQCHDNPDADALASGFAICWYLNNNGKKARFVYGGKTTIKKRNLVLMIETLGIEIEHVDCLSKPELLITVDCQYGEGNVTRFEADHVAVIDHHQVSKVLPDMHEVKSNYGSCATVIYKMFKEENVDVNSDICLASALFYGLYTDTNALSEISHPADKDLRDFSKYKNTYITLFKNSNISREELLIAGDALTNAKYYDEHSYAIVEAGACDPNILGLISDMLLEVDSVNTCIVYSILEFGVKLSVRSCIKEVKANELADYLCAGLGGGGGHLIKAGGFLKKELLEKVTVYDRDNVMQFLYERMQRYFEETIIIDTRDYREDVVNLSLYKKKELALGYVKACDIASPDTVITIRTLEGDVDVAIEKDFYIILGIEGEIYPCSREKFEKNYRLSTEEYSFPGEYPPNVINIATGEAFEILPYAKSCISIGGDGIYARQIDTRMKVFTEWDRDKYYLGVPGDFLAVRVDDMSDFYIVAKDIFYKTYELC